MAENQKKQTILVVDDTPDNIDILISILQSEFKVIVATSGKQALNIVKNKQRPDLILLDILMPEMDGYETCRHLKNDPSLKNLDVIFISAKDDLDSIITGYEAGGSDYLTKPVQPDELMQKVKLALHNKKLRVEIESEKNIAMETAMTAISSSGEQGIVLEFMRRSFTVKSIEQLASLIIESTANYQLKCSTQLRTTKQVFSHGLKEPVSPLEKELLFRIKDAGRLRKKGDYFVANFGNVTLLIKNMPKDDDKRGRLRDHLAILLEGAAARLDALELEEKLTTIINDSRKTLLKIEAMENEQKLKAIHIIDEVMDNLESSFLSYGLTESQEKELLNVVEKGAQQSLENFDQGLKLDQQIDTIIENLEKCTKR